MVFRCVINAFVKTSRTSVFTRHRPNLFRSNPPYAGKHKLVTDNDDMEPRRSASDVPMTLATYDDVKSAAESEEIVLVDVREATELRDSGRIPGCINIPLHDLEHALKLPPDRFQIQYGRRKPKTHDTIIFTCQTGRRSAMAYRIANRMGFTQLKNFDGGWVRYHEKELQRTSSSLS